MANSNGREIIFSAITIREAIGRLGQRILRRRPGNRDRHRDGDFHCGCPQTAPHTNSSSFFCCCPFARAFSGLSRFDSRYDGHCDKSRRTARQRENALNERANRKNEGSESPMYYCRFRIYRWHAFRANNRCTFGRRSPMAYIATRKWSGPRVLSITKSKHSDCHS